MWVIFRKRRSVDKVTLRREIAKLVLDLKRLHRMAFYYESRIEGKISNYRERLKYTEDPAVRRALVENVRMYEKALKVIARIEVALEAIVVRLDTLGLLNLSVKEVALIKEVLRRVKDMSSGIPDISLIAEDISERADNLLTYLPGHKVYDIHVTQEANQILQDALKVAEKRVHESLAA